MTRASPVFLPAGVETAHLSEPAQCISQSLRSASLIASSVIGLQMAGFYLMQRRGMFGKLMRGARRFARKLDFYGCLARRPPG